MAWYEIILYILIIILIISALVSIHEAGHLIAAKTFNVYCFDYSIGFGPHILHVRRKGGETYFSLRVIKSIPLTLAVLNNALRDVLMGMIPFYIGDVIDIFHRANIKNMQMIQGFVDGDEAIIKQVNQRAWQSAIVLIVLLLLIILMIWLLISFGSYLYSLVASII
jgi:membrane-associated protease RseP (regulator of RpoE activity)